MSPIIWPFPKTASGDLNFTDNLWHKYSLSLVRISLCHACLVNVNALQIVESKVALEHCANVPKENGKDIHKKVLVRIQIWKAKG